MSRRAAILRGALAALVAASCGAKSDGARVTGSPAPAPAPTAPERLALRVVARHPHDAQAFTQGLVWQDGKLYESTGLYGGSSVRRVDLATGTVEAKAPLEQGLFGEGLALVGDRLVQLTWREGRALRWTRSGLALDGEWRYEGEGWGLAFDGRELVQSDGSARLTFRDPATFAVMRTMPVTEGGRAVSSLNELEVVDGAIYANLWMADDIVRIDPASGHVTARIDAAPLHAEIAQEAPQADVLNGIAWRPETKTFLLTGKLWPTLFEVELVPAASGR
jgi:glutaminyl-peptide cyclotransferase